MCFQWYNKKDKISNQDRAPAVGRVYNVHDTCIWIYEYNNMKYSKQVDTPCVTSQRQNRYIEILKPAWDL